jgi:uncharacterized membrane protein (TIGR02234 family)
MVLGALAVVLGLSVFLAALAPITDPAAASAPAVTAVTGVAGQQSVRADVAAADITAWPWVALLAAALLAAAGVGVLLTGRRWPGPTRRYQARFVSAGTGSTTAPEGSGPGPDRAARQGDAVTDWDQLSRGDDPTA